MLWTHPRWLAVVGLLLVGCPGPQSPATDSPGDPPAVPLLLDSGGSRVIPDPVEYDFRDYFHLGDAVWKYAGEYSYPFSGPYQATGESFFGEPAEFDQQRYERLVLLTHRGETTDRKEMFLRWTDAGLVRFEPGPPPHTFLQFPAKLRVGDSWESQASAATLHSRLARVEDVVVGEVRYADCLVIESSWKTIVGESKLERWFAKGIGVVRHRESNPIVEIDSRLTEVRAGEPATR